VLPPQRGQRVGEAGEVRRVLQLEHGGAASLALGHLMRESGLANLSSAQHGDHRELPRQGRDFQTAPGLSRCDGQ